MTKTVFDFEPTIVLLEGLLEDTQNILEQELFQKAVRLYLYLRVIYGNGITCGNINIKLPDNIKEVWLKQWFKWADWRNKITTTDIVAENVFSSEENLDILKGISIKEILFNSNLDSEKSWRKLFTTTYYNVDTKIIDELIGTNQAPIYPFYRCERVLRNSFTELAKGRKHWLEPKINKNTRKRFTGNYHTVPVLPPIYDGKDQGDNSISRAIETQSPEYIQNHDLQDLVSKFISNSDSDRLLFETEYAIKDSSQYQDIINTLRINWFDNEVIKPTKIIYQKFINSNVVEQIIYPIAWFYTQRAPYLYFVSEQDREIVWDAYRLDRIKQLQIVNWDELSIPSLLYEAYQDDLLPAPEDIQCYLQADKALGYAFWKPKKWTIVRFNRSHYEKYIQATSRDELWFDLDQINSTSLSKVIKDKTKKFNRINGNIFPIVESRIDDNQLKSLDKILSKTSHRGKYVFCLARYYEGDSYVLQRLLSWGKQVKVLFPQKLKIQVSEEIKATWEMYQE